MRYLLPLLLLLASCGSMKKTTHREEVNKQSSELDLSSIRNITTIEEGVDTTITLGGDDFITGTIDPLADDTSEQTIEGEGLSLTFKKDPRTGKTNYQAKTKPQQVPVKISKKTTSYTEGASAKQVTKSEAVLVSTRHKEREAFIPPVLAVLLVVVLLALLVRWLYLRFIKRKLL